MPLNSIKIKLNNLVIYKWSYWIFCEIRVKKLWERSFKIVLRWIKNPSYITRSIGWKYNTYINVLHYSFIICDGGEPRDRRKSSLPIPLTFLFKLYNTYIKYVFLFAVLNFIYYAVRHFDHLYNITSQYVQYN